IVTRVTLTKIKEPLDKKYEKFVEALKAKKPTDEKHDQFKKALKTILDNIRMIHADELTTQYTRPHTKFTLVYLGKKSLIEEINNLIENGVDDD
ncbi:MAG: hypothetical protein V3V61_03945, partial [Gammaproteobacteria bacterium]